MVKEYLRSSNRVLIPFLDWGYILVWIAACILLVLGMTFILAPMPFVHHSPKGTHIHSHLFRFFGNGLYVFRNIPASAVHPLFYDPIFSACVVIGSFLVYSGIGSLIAGKVRPFKSKHIFWSVLIIGIASLIFLTSDRWLQNALSGFPLWLRMISCSLIIAPLAIPMGIPFPSGLSELTPGREGLIPWAWSINGFFSVIGSSTTVLIAITCGFKAIILIAVVSICCQHSCSAG